MSTSCQSTNPLGQKTIRYKNNPYILLEKIICGHDIFKSIITYSESARNFLSNVLVCTDGLENISTALKTPSSWDFHGQGFY